jgi:hypothetical protein
MRSTEGMRSSHTMEGHRSRTLAASRDPELLKPTDLIAACSTTGAAARTIGTDEGQNRNWNPTDLHRCHERITEPHTLHALTFHGCIGLH